MLVIVATELFVDLLPFYGAIAEQCAPQERSAFCNAVQGFPCGRPAGLGLLARLFG